MTAHNKAKFKKRSRACGCFRCGSRFRADEVVEWLQEEEGEESALCPYCGTDAVVYGNAKFPMSTALLSLLYMSWYSQEYRDRKAKALLVPDYSREGDYLRKGIPFLMRDERFVEFIDEITLFPARISYYEQGFISDPECFVESVSAIEDKDDWVVAKMASFTDEDGFRRVVFIDGKGKHLPFEPKTTEELQRVLDEIDRYGNALRGVVKDWKTRRLKLYIGKPSGGQTSNVHLRVQSPGRFPVRPLKSQWVQPQDSRHNGRRGDGQEPVRSVSDGQGGHGRAR